MVVYYLLTNKEKCDIIYIEIPKEVNAMSWFGEQVLKLIDSYGLKYEKCDGSRGREDYWLVFPSKRERLWEIVVYSEYANFYLQTNPNYWNKLNYSLIDAVVNQRIYAIDELKSALDETLFCVNAFNSLYQHT